MKYVILLILLLLLAIFYIYISQSTYTGWDQLYNARKIGIENIYITKSMEFRRGRRLTISAGETITIYSPDLIKVN